MTQLSPAAARDAAGYVGSWLAFRRRHLRLPGLQAAIGDRSGPFTEIADGQAGTDVPMTTRHLFRIASHSKTFTATAVLQLVEDGALRLDDPLSSRLDWTADGPLATVTLRELLSHSGGVIRDGRAADWWQLSYPFPDAAGVAALAGAEADVLEPSERFKYSNVGYALLGAVVSAASGRSYNEVVRDRIVDRLGLQDTGPEWDPARADDYAAGYSALSYAEHRRPIDHVDTRALSPATGFASTAGDLCRYAAAHFDGDDRLIGDHSKRLMRTAGWPVPGSDNRYGLGLERTEVAGVTLFGHGGGYPGHSTRTLFDPEGGVAVSVLTNAIDGPAGSLADGVVKIIVAAAEEPEPGQAVDPAVDRFCGRFASLWGVLDVVRLGRRLLIVPPAADDPLDRPTVLVPEGVDRLRVAESSGYGSFAEELRYDFAEDGSVRSIGGPSGIRHFPIDVITELVAGHDRVGAGTIPGS